MTQASARRRSPSVERHNPAVKYVQKAMMSGQYGRLISIMAKRVSSFPGRIHDVGVVVDREDAGASLGRDDRRSSTVWPFMTLM